ncbi:MAG: hypothetical protein NUW37_05275 [Planctomycetes bacterium]|nr:hypothetical protein [Planctomycetota bacterium]
MQIFKRPSYEKFIEHARWRVRFQKLMKWLGPAMTIVLIAVAIRMHQLFFSGHLQEARNHTFDTVRLLSLTMTVAFCTIAGVWAIAAGTWLRSLTVGQADETLLDLHSKIRRTHSTQMNPNDEAIVTETKNELRRRRFYLIAMPLIVAAASAAMIWMYCVSQSAFDFGVWEEYSSFEHAKSIGVTWGAVAGEVVFMVFVTIFSGVVQSKCARKLNLIVKYHDALNDLKHTASDL